MPTKLVSLRKSAFKAQSSRCSYCCFPMWENDPESFARIYNLTLAQARWFKCTAEHLVAKQDGGLDVADNIVAACLWCNSKRHRSKAAPAPNVYRRLVQQRLSKGRWHFKSSFKTLMVGEMNAAESGG